MNLIEVLISLILLSTTLLSLGFVGLQSFEWLKEGYLYSQTLIEIQNLRSHHQAYQCDDAYILTWQSHLKEILPDPQIEVRKQADAIDVKITWPKHEIAVILP